MPKHNERILRLALSLIVALIIAFLARMSMQSSLQHGPQWRTQRSLQFITELMKDYQEKNLTFPQSAEELAQAAKDRSVPYEKGLLLDGWQRPFIYQTDGKTYDLISYGRDGKPGGAGLDCDLSTSNTDTDNAAPTWGQILFDMTTPKMLWWCAACGALAFALSLVVFRKINFTRRGVLIIVVKLALVLLAALIVSFLMAILETTGH